MNDHLQHSHPHHHNNNNNNNSSHHNHNHHHNDGTPPSHASPFGKQHQPETAHPLYENLDSALANLSVDSSEYDVAGCGGDYGVVTGCYPAVYHPGAAAGAAGAAASQSAGAPLATAAHPLLPPVPPRRPNALRASTPNGSLSSGSMRQSGSSSGGGIPDIPVLATPINDPSNSIVMSLSSMICQRCGEGFEAHEKIVNSHGETWHQSCFVCSHCFRPFPDGVFYEFEGRKYCEHDFHVLYAPSCGKCNEFIIGRVIKAMNKSWHPACFCCEICNQCLADSGFIKNANRALCHECNAREKAAAIGKHICYKCHGIIDDKPLKWRNEPYHAYHFNCTTCGVELTSEAREVKGDLYCLRCHDRMGIPICGACRRPIEERVVTALGKHWHVEHFVCAKCEKPFMGHKHFEKKGLAYCETHYHQLFGNLCYTCNKVIEGDVFTALNKAWCVNHFACSVCNEKMNQKTKFYELDLKPVCKRCYEKFSSEFRKRIQKLHKIPPKKQQTT